MNEFKNIFNRSDIGENLSQEELLRHWQEAQADIPELSDVDITLTDFPTQTEKLAIRRGASNWSGFLMLAIVGLVLLSGAFFTLTTWVSPLAGNPDSEPKIQLHQHELKQPVNSMHENDAIQEFESVSVPPFQGANQQISLEEPTKYNRGSIELPELETLAIQGLDFKVFSPTLKVSRYAKDFNYKYMRNYKVYNYENRSMAYDLNSEKLNLDPRYPNWNEYRFYQKDMGMTFREYEELLYKALTYMDKERYREVDLIFFSIMKFYPNDQNAWFYSGISSFKQMNYTDALHCFETIMNDYPSVFKQEAHWYYALSLLELNKQNESKNHLLEIVESNGFYKEHAQKLLADLK